MDGAAGEGGGAGEFIRAPGLEGLSGRLRVTVPNAGGALLEVSGGGVRLLAHDRGQADAVARVDSLETLRKLQEGKLNPVMAALQGCLVLDGDLPFAIKVILGLQVGRPLAPTVRA
jgi:hypothetical protein